MLVETHNKESGSTKLAQLLQRIGVERDQSAFAELYHSTRGKLFSTAMRIVRRGHVAEEIIQDSYSRIWIKADTYKLSLGSPMNWMIFIVRNLSIDAARKLSWEYHSDDSTILELATDSPNALEEIECREDEQATKKQTRDIFAALESLDPARRELVIAAYINCESRELLSQKAGVPVSTVKTWLRRSLLEIKQIVRNSQHD